MSSSYAFSPGITWDSREPVSPKHSVAVCLAPAILDISVGIIPDPPRQHESRKAFPTNVVREIDRNVLPAVSVSIVAHIAGGIAEVTATQVFWNDADVPIIQGSYTFGLPNGCTVTEFTCRVGNGKLLRTTARPKAEAHEAFCQAVASHAVTALLDQNTPEIFTSSLGNIPSNTRIKTQITYATILKRRFGDNTNTATLIIPMHIAGRYGERPLGLKGLNLGAKPDDTLLRIEILESEQIRSITSISHEILVERDTRVGQAQKWDHISQGSDETAIVTMKEPANCLRSDFVISIDRVLVSENKIAQDGEILFVADRSGSMGDKMENLKSAMRFFLKGIPVGRSFNIWCFGTHHQSLWTKSQMYGQESLRQALEFVNIKFHSDMGGTEILPALETIIATRDPSLSCDVVILTDGEVWQLDETIDLVRAAHESSKGAIRFFSLGLGSQVSHALVEGIAKQGGGYSEVIPHAADKEGWEERMVAMLKSALTCHVGSLRLDLVGLKGITSPKNLEALNPFNTNQVFLLLEKGKIPEDGCVKLDLVSDSQPMLMDVYITKIRKPGTLIHALSARAILDDLERVTNPDGFFAEQLACKYSLSSKWTSLFLQQEGGKLLGTQNTPEASVQIVTSQDQGTFLQRREVRSRAQDTFLRSRGLDYFVPRGKRLNYCMTQEEKHSGTSAPFQTPRSAHCLEVDPTVMHRADRGLQCDTETSSLSQRRPLMTKLRLEKGTKLPLEKEFVSFVLSRQGFDGSIESRPLNGRTHAIVHSLKQWLGKKTRLAEGEIALVANTALAVAFLERDYQDSKGLWVMIREKAAAYIHLQLSQSDLESQLMEYSRNLLGPPRLVAPFQIWDPLSRPELGVEGADAPNLAVREHEGKRDSDAEGQDQLSPGRVLLERAPVD
ncbi:putative von Willebrand factor type A domain-containing protein [Rosellinia necatrix]|uniref:Putative von Willebrand factor type A domain-containing protein n=1 Tax=Rosellinia necatrix TaxID=77044 RepID=A0A1W2TJ98_ROSNE|nr:putative von Willebrand factor type A domain-containing protein [Rosellinia necatrix]